MHLYFIHTSTTTLLSRVIGFYTKNSYNHVSISFAPDLAEVYSFGRKEINNPLFGGFVNEDLAQGFFSEATCCIYRLKISEAEYLNIKSLLEEFAAKRERLRYNFLGLLCLSVGVELSREHYYFCSEFAATLLDRGTKLSLPKAVNLMTPQDLAGLPEMVVIYEGRLANYLELNALAEYGYHVDWQEKIEQLVPVG